VDCAAGRMQPPDRAVRIVERYWHARMPAPVRQVGGGGFGKGCGCVACVGEDARNVCAMLCVRNKPHCVAWLQGGELLLNVSSQDSLRGSRHSPATRDASISCVLLLLLLLLLLWCTS